MIRDEALPLRNVRSEPPRSATAPVAWTEHDVAMRLGVSVHLVRKWRMRGIGPRYHKLAPGRGGAVRYDPEEVERYWAGTQRTGTGD